MIKKDFLQISYLADQIVMEKSNKDLNDEIEKENKYDFIVSDYDVAKKMDQRIIQAYVKVAIEKALAKNGFKIKVNVNDEDFLKQTMSEMEIVARKLI